MTNQPIEYISRNFENDAPPPYPYTTSSDIKADDQKTSEMSLRDQNLAEKIPTVKPVQPQAFQLLPNIQQQTPTETTINIPAQSQTNADGWGDFSTITDKTIRMKFIRKVYAILTLQLLITFGIVVVFATVQAIKDFAVTNAGFGLYIASFVIFFIIIIVMSCCQCSNQLRKFPLNYILLTIVTLSMSLMLGMVSAYNTTQAVLIAVGVTSIVVLGVTLFAIQSKFDFTNCWLLLFCLILSLVVSCISIGVAYRYNVVMAGVYGGIGATLMAIFLAIDTQLLMGRKGKLAFSPEDYVNAALQLYIDICYIFIYILTAVGGSKR